MPAAVCIRRNSSCAAATLPDAEVLVSAPKAGEVHSRRSAVNGTAPMKRPTSTTTVASMRAARCSMLRLCNTIANGNPVVATNGTEVYVHDPELVILTGDDGHVLTPAKVLAQVAPKRTVGRLVDGVDREQVMRDARR